MLTKPSIKPHLHESGCWAIGENLSSYGKREIVLVNPHDRDVWDHSYVLAFGAYGWTVLQCWADSLERALDEALDWIEEHEPGLLCDTADLKAEADSYIKEHSLDPEDEAAQEKAWEHATVDLTCGGNHGVYIASWEWSIVAEAPTRADLLEIIGAA